MTETKSVLTSNPIEKNTRFRLSSITIAIVVIACLSIDFTLKNWEKQDRVIEHDVHWYYAYLPAIFIYDDIKLTKSDYRQAVNYYMFWTVTTPEGKKIIKSTIGLSVLYAPFFFVAHAFASLTNYPDDGFSEPYKIFLLLSAVFYLFIGLNFLRKILRHYNFSDATIASTLLLVGLGTNLLCYSSQSATMPHVYNFCLFSIFIYYTIRWYESQSMKNTIILGLVLGLISLIRPSNVIIMIFFAFYGISSLSELKQRLVFFRKEWFLINVIFFFALLLWIPQFMYWKKVTGNYLVYSYPDEGFFFNRPHILDGLFSFRKGWLVYTPMMVFALAGIFLMKNALKKLRLPVVLFFIMNVYIIFSWWCWWYGGTYGQRSMVDGYALLAIPFASFMQYLSGKKRVYNILFYCIALFFIWLNIFQTFQFEYHSLHWDGMSKKLYFKQFGKIDKVEDYEKLIDYPDYEAAKKGKKPGANSPQLPDKTPVRNYEGKEEVSRKLIYLKAANDKYVSADKTLNNAIVANRDHAYAWETFVLIMFGNNRCAIRADDNQFVCAELDQAGKVNASRVEVGMWESFTITELDSNHVAFKAANDKYLSLDEESLQLFANAVSIGVKEKFKLIIESNK